MSIKAKCDACSHEFKIKKLKTRIVRDGVKVHYFVCPGCHCVFKTHYINNAITKQQGIVNRARAALNNPLLSTEQLSNNNMELKIEEAKLKNMMYELAFEFEKK